MRLIIGLVAPAVLLVARVVGGSPILVNGSFELGWARE